MWKFIKYSFNKAFEKNLLNLIIFFLILSFIGIIFLSTIIFALQKVGLLSENNFGFFDDKKEFIILFRQISLTLSLKEAVK